MNSFKVVLGLLVSVVVCTAEPPVNTYLPSSRTSPSARYGAPSSRPNSISPQYGVPNSRNLGQFLPNFQNRLTQYGAPGFGGNRQNGIFRPQFGQGYQPSAQYGAALPNFRPNNRFPTASFLPSAQYGAPAGLQGGAGNYRNGANGAYASNGYNNGYSGGDDQSEPANYEFSYEVNAPEYGVELGHSESRQGDDTRGTYFVLLPDGRRQRVDYTADLSGYKPVVSYEDTTAGARGAGYYGGAEGYQTGRAGGYGGYNGGGAYQTPGRSLNGPY